LVRETAATRPRSTIARAHSPRAAVLGKRLRTRPLTAQLKVLNRRSVHGVVSRSPGMIRGRTRSAIMSRPPGLAASLSIALALLWSSAAAAQGVADAERHYDARIDYNAAFISSQRALPAPANKAFAANLEEASVEADAATGAVTALTSQRGYLTEKASGT